jgi:(2Fe-2S) ferredoxin
VLRNLLEIHELLDEVDLAADLCLDNCIQAPNVVVDGTTFGGITPDRAEEFFSTQILAKVSGDAVTGNHHDY